MRDRWPDGRDAQGQVVARSGWEVSGGKEPCRGRRVSWGAVPRSPERPNLGQTHVSEGVAGQQSWGQASSPGSSGNVAFWAENSVYMNSATRSG